MEKIMVELDRDVLVLIAEYLANESEKCHQKECKSYSYNMSSFYGKRAHLLGENLYSIHSVLQ